MNPPKEASLEAVPRTVNGSGLLEKSNNTRTPRSLYRSYDEQFKRNAVALLEGGRRPAQLARELGVSIWNLRDWRRRFGSRSAAAAEAGVHGNGNGAGETGVNGAGSGPEDLLAAMQRELASLRVQNEILKKALAIVSQQHGTAWNTSMPPSSTPQH